ncbi:ATP-grasp domain-containing protein [Halomonas alkaliantarctica]|nr:ATP-grasp domain-containing protein [Halomonas alkaliantarctica]
MSWNVFVIGYDDLGKRLFPDFKYVDDYTFYPLLPLDEVVYARDYHFDQLVEDAVKEINDAKVAPDAIVGYWDFPTTALAPVLRQRFNLPGPSLEAVLKCEHKYWSRVEQAKVVPECVPDFQAVDPFADDPVAQIHIDYPFWLKPIKAHSSHLGFMIENADQLREVIPQIREKIGSFARPFEEVMAYADPPEEIAKVTGYHCIAEQVISQGEQCTIEGYVHNGEVHMAGLIDTVRDEKHRSVLMQYHYPSRLPQKVQERILALSTQVMRQFGFDDSPFNIEYYYHADTDTLRLLEVNSRLSRSHAAIFQLVDGAPHFQVMVDVALGIETRMPKGEGRYNIAAKKMIRVFEKDGIVKRVPTEEEIRNVEETFPGTKVNLEVKEGDRLSDLLFQDSFSYELAVVFIGGEDKAQLDDNIDRCLKMLPFDIDPINEETS